MRKRPLVEKGFVIARISEKAEIGVVLTKLERLKGDIESN